MRAVRILERALVTIPIMLSIAILVFLFMRLSPGDPVDIMLGQEGTVTASERAQLRHEFHLDEPVHVQLWLFLKGAVRGDLGYSYVHKRPVKELIADRLPATIELALGAFIFSLIVSIPIGIISAARQRSLIDQVSMIGALLGTSMPSFWLGIVLILFLCVRLQWLPAYGRIGAGVGLERVTGLYVLDSVLTKNRPALITSLKHLVLPSISLGVGGAATVARVLRSSMVDIMQQHYITLAHAKGQSEFLVVMRHALRNALIPTVTVVGLQVGALLGGNTTVETVFGWPGLGTLVIQAITNRDFPLVQASVMVYAFTFAMANLVVDVLYTYLNPKVEL